MSCDCSNLMVKWGSNEGQVRVKCESSESLVRVKNEIWTKSANQLHAFGVHSDWLINSNTSLLSGYETLTKTIFTTKTCLDETVRWCIIIGYGANVGRSSLATDQHNNHINLIIKMTSETDDKVTEYYLSDDCPFNQKVESCQNFVLCPRYQRNHFSS